MAGSLNKVSLIGRLGADPELRYTEAGAPVANFRIATSECWKDANGERHERTEWHRIVTWANLAKICGEYLKKGRRVYLEGRLQTREWDDKEGNKRSTTEIVAKEVTFLDGAGGDSKPGVSVNEGDTAEFDYGPPPMEPNGNGA